jgi:hypothetical protein
MSVVENLQLEETQRQEQEKQDEGGSQYFESTRRS